jgi:hypothetical protein
MSRTTAEMAFHSHHFYLHLMEERHENSWTNEDETGQETIVYNN